MAEAFTDLALLAIHRAGIEARKLDHHHLDTEDLLLGLMCVGEGIGARALATMACTVPGARAWVEVKLGRGTRPAPMDPQLTPAVRRVIDRAGLEAMQLGQEQIGTGHLLLGIIEEEEGGVMQVLRAMHVDVDHLRRLIRLNPIDPERDLTTPSADQEHQPRTPLADLDRRLTTVEIAIADILEWRVALGNPGPDPTTSTD